MTPELFGGLGLAILLGLLALGVPIGAALIVVGAGGMALLVSPEAALIKSGVVAFETLSRYELGVLPLFLLMAHLCFSAGASRDFFAAASRFVGHKPGGLAVASIAACAGFGSISGSSLATAATVGAVALPEMRKQGYSPALATGALAADHQQDQQGQVPDVEQGLAALRPGRARRGRAELGIEPAHDDDGDDVEDRLCRRRDQRGDEQLADRLLGDDAEHDQGA